MDIYGIVCVTVFVCECVCEKRNALRAQKHKRVQDL